MKKLLTTLIALLLTSISFAQDGFVGHLEFKGVAINGSIDEFVSEMESAGFKKKSINNGVAVLTGDFAGEKNCKINVITLQPQNLVNKITVYFPTCSTWPDLSEMYEKLKYYLTGKYGEPQINVQKFKSYVSQNDDSSRMMLARIGKCEYVTSFALPNGIIELSIYSDMADEPRVSLTYTDKENSEIIEQQIIDDL